MGDEPTTPAEPQAGATGNAPQPQAGTTTPPTPQAGSGKTFLTPEEYERRLAETAKEAAGYRAKLKVREDKDAADQLAAMSELDKERNLREQAEARLKQQQEQFIAEKIMNAAFRKGIIDPELAALAILQDKSQLDDEGMPTDVEKALDALIKKRPYLVPKPTEPALTTPAQTAQPQQAPAIPAMAVNAQGRGTINSPASGAQPGKPTRWNEVPWKS